MSFLRVLPLAALFASAIATALPAQQRPSADQARMLLQASPEMVEQLRQRLLNSGLTRDQIRARLRAEGYPENLLDAYLPGGRGDPNAPTEDLYAAIQELGLADTADVSVFRTLQSDTLSPQARDSLLMARGMLAADSLGSQRARRVIRSDVSDSLVRADSGYNIFGLQMFLEGANRIEPTMLGPVDENYRLGPGDRLVLILTGDVETSHVLDVTREGFVLIPQVGQLYVNNLTLGQLNDVLYTRLGRVYSGVRRGEGATTRFSVTVSRLRTNQVYVMGEVERPGSYMVSSAGTALTSLYSAGGPTANGSMREVQIKRGGRVVSVVDLYDYLLRGDASRDARLETGDIVFVPSRGPRVRVVGEVIRPATYEMKPGETLAHVIAAAGGFHANALRSRVQIERVVPPSQRGAEGRDRVTIEVSAEAGPEALSQVPVLAGDVVRVFPIADRLRNTITVEGNVWTPGPIGIRPGMTVSDAIRMAGGPRPDVYLGQILVSRLRPDSTRVQLRAALRDTTGAVINDFAVQEDDLIEIFSVTDFRPTRYVAIGGAVRQGGRFPYRRGMTMRDLVLLAGGLKEGAYLTEAEIARLPERREGLNTATTIRVPLDSTYLFDRRAGEEYLGAPGLPASSSGAPEVELQPYDNVLIMQQPNWELQRVVTIAGEVRFPGQYALKLRTERLADLIQRAGGLTSEAYAEGAVFKRARESVGRVALDVPQALRNPASPENLILMDGDSITIPVRSNVVTVRGAVNAPNVLAYVPGQSLDYYIRAAGGAAREADEKRAFVTQPSGKREVVRRRFFFPDGVPEPRPGSIVIVPEADPADRTDVVAVINSLLPIVSTLTSIAVVILSRQ